jgi:aminopeptidase YwaD
VIHLKVFDPDSAYKFMETLVKEVGNRESATDSELKAAERIKGWFEQFGLSNVRFDEFDVVTSRVLREEATLPNGEKVECAALGNSLSTPPEGVEGKVTMLEATSQEELRKIEGKIVAVNVRPSKEKFIKIVKAKPQALIYPSRTPVAPAYYGSEMAEYTEKENIPIVSISHDDLLSIIKGNKRLRILTKVEKFTAKSRNVTGELPGEIEDEEILVGGHYDTVRNVLGAHDNAAGVVTALELARVFAGEKLTRTIKFAAFGSEELGLRGSLHYAENEENIKNLGLYLNLDVHGILIGQQSAVIFGPEDLKALVQLTAKELGVAIEVSTEPRGTGGSDHMSLALYGVPAISLSRYGGAAQIMHTALEDLRWCGPEAFAPVGKLCQTLLTRLANAGDFPFEKEIPSETAKALEKRLHEWGIEKKTKEKKPE